MAEYRFEVTETTRCVFSIGARSAEEAARLWQRARESPGFCDMLVERVRDSEDSEFDVPEAPGGFASEDSVDVTDRALVAARIEREKQA